MKVARSEDQTVVLGPNASVSEERRNVEIGARRSCARTHEHAVVAHVRMSAQTCQLAPIHTYRHRAQVSIFMIAQEPVLSGGYLAHPVPLLDPNLGKTLNGEQYLILKKTNPTLEKFLLSPEQRAAGKTLADTRIIERITAARTDLIETEMKMAANRQGGPGHAPGGHEPGAGDDPMAALGLDDGLVASQKSATEPESEQARRLGRGRGRRGQTRNRRGHGRGNGRGHGRGNGRGHGRGNGPRTQRTKVYIPMDALVAVPGTDRGDCGCWRVRLLLEKRTMAPAIRASEEHLGRLVEEAQKDIEVSIFQAVCQVAFPHFHPGLRRSSEVLEGREGGNRLVVKLPWAALTGIARRGSSQGVLPGGQRGPEGNWIKIFQ